MPDATLPLNPLAMMGESKLNLSRRNEPLEELRKQELTSRHKRAGDLDVTDLANIGTRRNTLVEQGILTDALGEPRDLSQFQRYGRSKLFETEAPAMLNMAKLGMFPHLQPTAGLTASVDAPVYRGIPLDVAGQFAGADKQTSGTMFREELEEIVPTGQGTYGKGKKIWEGKEKSERKGARATDPNFVTDEEFATGINKGTAWESQGEEAKNIPIGAIIKGAPPRQGFYINRTGKDGDWTPVTLRSNQADSRPMMYPLGPPPSITK
jgi:hypothetical protein